MLTLPSDMFWSEPGRDPVDLHLVDLTFRHVEDWSEPGIDVGVPGDPHTVDLTFRHVLVSAR